MPLPREIASLADAHGEQQAALADEALGLLSQAHRRGNTSNTAWRDAIAAIAERLLLIQVAAASLAEGYVSDVLEAQDADPSAEASVNVDGFSDFTDGGGSLLQYLVYAGNAVRESALEERLPPAVARQRAVYATTAILVNGMQDTGRSAVHSDMWTRPSVKGYVRMLRPPSCARCAILAGRRYWSSQAFKRHKRCDCRHVPVAEDTGGDWTTSPSTYFKSLSREEQDRIFTKASAETIRLANGKADTINQVVNARKGMTTTAFFGHELVVTTDGVTRRGLFGKYRILDDGTWVLRDAADTVRRPGRTGTRTYRYPREPRLMPDQIFQFAEEENWDRAEVLSRLRRYGYIF